MAYMKPCISFKEAGILFESVVPIKYLWFMKNMNLVVNYTLYLNVTHVTSGHVIYQRLLILLRDILSA